MPGPGFWRRQRQSWLNDAIELENKWGRQRNGGNLKLDSNSRRNLSLFFGLLCFEFGDGIPKPLGTSHQLGGRFIQ